MAHIRAKTWTKLDGSVTKKFELTYTDKAGKRHTKMFDLKRDADAERVRIENELAEGTHVSPKNSRSVIKGLRAWLFYMEGLERAGKRERITVDHYRTHIEHHIAKADIAIVSLAELSPADVQKFVEHLETNLSTCMAKKVYQTLSMSLKYCRKHQWLRHVPTEDIRIESRDRDHSGKVTIPSKEEIAALIKAADQDITGIDAAIVRVSAFCGLRPSEMRGLPRQLVRLDTNPPTLEVAQRADLYGKLGKPKSRAGYRKIPIGPDTVKALKKAMLAHKSGRHNLVFPNTEGYVMNYHNYVHRRWPQLMERAGLAKVDTVIYKSSPKRKVRRITPNFSPYALRHVAASLWIEMGLAPKRIQELMGHTSLKMTMDTYGHLWANPEADKKMAVEIERTFKLH